MPGRKRRYHRQTRRPEETSSAAWLETVLTIDRISTGGDGVGRSDGLVVFVPRTAPGDRVRVVYSSHGRFGRGRVVELLEAGSGRIEPRCPHYVADRCGGCQLQHLSTELQREMRCQIVKDSIGRIAGRSIPLPGLVSDLEWEYRSRLTLTLERTGKGWYGGLHPYDNAGEVFPLERCDITRPALVGAWNSIKPLLNDPAFNLNASGGLRLSLRQAQDHENSADTSDQGVVLLFQGGTHWSGLEAWATLARNRVDDLKAVWWESSAGLREHVAFVPESSDNALAFAQVNPRMATLLRASVLEAVMGLNPRFVVDGYSGSGILSAQLARAGVKVLAVEADPMGARGAVERLEKAGTAASALVRVLSERMEDAVASITDVPDVIVLNPPRRGVDVRVTAWLESMAVLGARAVVYISCDPATLARDLKRMPSWEIVSVECFDMFPQTAHVETLCILKSAPATEAA